MEQGRPPGFGRGWVGIGLAVMFVLIGVAAVLAVIYRPAGTGPSGFPGFGWIWGLFALFFVFWAFSWAFSPFWWRRRFYSGGGPGGWQHRDPLEILGIRYARGEITQEEYLRMKQDLQK